MFRVLNGLNVSLKIQDHICQSVLENEDGTLTFDYIRESELFNVSHHHTVPRSENIWVGGDVVNSVVKHVIIGYSAMETISFLELHGYRYSALDSVALIATGYQPSFIQAQLITQVFSSSKITTIFGNDLFGALADIVIATGIHRIPVALAMDRSGMVNIRFRSSTFHFHVYDLSLNSFEREVKMRFGTRTRKLKGYNSYLDVLKAKCSIT